MKKGLVIFVALIYLIASSTIGHKERISILVEDKNDECIEINGYVSKV